MATNIEVDCPDCGTLLVIDRETGEVLWHKAKETEQKRDLDAMVSGLRGQKDEMAKKFEKNLEAQKDRKRILDEKFKEALQRADKSDKPMKNPLDLD
ncbi:MAG TPA: 2-nitropropane dioxygenase [Thermoanaerobaculia bacterium]